MTLRELRHVEDLRALDLFAPSTGANGAITMICGLHLAQRPDGWLSAAGWTRALEALGYTASTARSSLRRMTEAGYLVREPREGAAGYAMSSALRGLLQGSSPAEPDDDRWLLVTVRVPESRRDMRRQLRTLLARGGFGALGNGVWLGPPQHAARALEFAEALGMNDYLDVFLAEHVGPEQVSSLAARCWDLEAIARAYADAFAEVEAMPARLTPEEAFAMRLHLAQRGSALLQLDPGFPASALPPDWPGPRVRAALERFMAEHAEAADSWLLRY